MRRNFDYTQQSDVRLMSVDLVGYASHFSVFLTCYSSSHQKDSETHWMLSTCRLLHALAFIIYIFTHYLRDSWLGYCAFPFISLTSICITRSSVAPVSTSYERGYFINCVWERVHGKNGGLFQYILRCEQ